MKLISLTPCMATRLKRVLRKSGIPPEIASIRFWHEGSAYFYEAMGQPANHVKCSSRGVPLTFPEHQIELFRDATVCWYPSEFGPDGGWWIDNEEMWSGRGTATDPLRVNTTYSRIREVRPDWFGLRGYGLRVVGKLSSHDRQQWCRFLDWHLERGDSRAAIVLQTRPLLIAAYSDDLQAAAVLRFPNWLADRHHLETGTRLVTVNTYYQFDHRAADLPPVDRVSNPWTNYRPIIADFLSDEVETIHYRKNNIGNREYELARSLGEQYLRFNSDFCRSGLPFDTGRDTQLISARG